MIFELSATSYNRRIGILYTKKIKLLKRINGVLAGGKIFDQYIFLIYFANQTILKRKLYFEKKITKFFSPKIFCPKIFFHFFFKVA